MRWALAFLLVSASLAGCLGDDESGDDTLRKAQVQLTEDTGAIQGVVTDVAIQPLGDATLTLVELEMETTTEEDGSFALNGIPPGTYTLEADKEGHVPSTAPVKVVANEALTTDFVLTPLASQQAYTELFELQGFIECSVGWKVAPVGGLHPVVDFATNNGLALCTAPNGFQENTTNDRFSHIIQFGTALQGAYYKLEWTPNNQFGTELSYSSHLASYQGVSGAELAREAGPGPIELIADRAKLDEVLDQLETWCEEGDDTACGENPEDNGWTVSSRVFAARDCLNDQVTACGLVQQDFRVLIEAFYNQPVPAGYTLS